MSDLAKLRLNQITVLAFIVAAGVTVDIFRGGDAMVMNNIPSGWPSILMVTLSWILVVILIALGVRGVDTSSAQTGVNQGDLGRSGGRTTGGEATTGPTEGDAD